MILKKKKKEIKCDMCEKALKNTNHVEHTSLCVVLRSPKLTVKQRLNNFF